MFRSALGGLGTPPVEAFMTAASPGIIATTMLNAHYDSYEAYVFALARQMRKEYELIARDFILQIDAPDLAMERSVLFHDKSAAGVPRDRRDAYRGAERGAGRHPARPRAAALLLGQLRRPARPRHRAHRDPAGALPGQGRRAQRSSSPIRATSTNTPRSRRPNCRPSLLLLPGVIDSTTNYVEHPEVVANRICEAVDAVGDRSRVIASSDCGFGTFAGSELVAEDVVWAKLSSCREGADIATRRLWGKA